MIYEIKGSDFASSAKIVLNKDESAKIENGSMIYQNDKITLKGELNGKGLFKAIGRSLSGGESMFITTAQSSDIGGEIGIAPALPGKIISLKCGSEQWIINDSAFLASDMTIEYTMERKNGAGTSLLGGSGGLFNMVTSGEGIILVNSFGDIIEYELSPGETLTVDDSHIVAWSANTSSKMRVASGMFGFTTGEGLVVDFVGPGMVYIQTRQIPALASAIARYMPNKGN